jgi:two-component system alkaline phosphatase synthesis response regulator PhoP
MNEETKILIIEDDVDLVEAMKITLETEKYKVLTAYGPEDGFDMAKKEKPHLIILDVMFGETEEKKGFDYAVRMKQEKALASIPILMVTSVNVQLPTHHFSPKTDGEYLPVDEFIDKPAPSKELTEKVKKLLELKTSRWVNWPNPSSQ